MNDAGAKRTNSLLFLSAIALAACDLGGSAAGPAASGPSDPSSAQAMQHRAAVAPESPISTTAATAALTRVHDISQVCMVNDQFMGREQIPVAVEGKTYFGCCEMCKGRLATDASSRTAKDPVTGKLIDKAVAVVAKRSNGQVLYFESEQTLDRYRSM